MLKHQFRMHPDISSVVSRVSYKNTLTNAANTLNEARQHAPHFRDIVQILAAPTGKDVPPTQALIISPTRRAEYHYGSLRRANSTSRYNLQNCEIVLKLVAALIDKGVDPQEIFVESFYKDQIQLLKAALVDYPAILVATVDGSQGSERDISIIDCVTYGASANESMGFLVGANNRFNVAMSRPKVGRIVILPEDAVQG